MNIAVRSLTTLVLLGLSARFAQGQQGGCDSDLRERSRGLEVAYDERPDNPDKCCEGQFKEDVSVGSKPRVYLVEYGVGPRPKEFSSDVNWNIAWPAVPTGVYVRGRHSDFRTRYRIDAQRPGSIGGGPIGSFTWNCSRAVSLKFQATQVLFAAWVQSRGPGQDPENWDALKPDTVVYLPTEIRAVPVGATKPGVAKDDKPTGEAPVAPPPGDAEAAHELRLSLASNLVLDGVTISVRRLGAGPDAEPEVCASNLALTSNAKLVKLRVAPGPGAILEIMMTCVQRGREVPIDPIYLLCPSGLKSQARADTREVP